MLQNFGASNGALLIDVANDKNSNPLPFCQLHHGHGAVFYLGDTARRRVIAFTVQGLYGIGDENVGFAFLHSLQNIAQAGF